MNSYRLATLSRAACRRQFSAPPRQPLPPTPRVPPPLASRKTVPPPTGAAAAKTHGIGTGKAADGLTYIKDRGPVSWTSLFLVGIAAASCVAYYNVERERRLETAMGRVVSSESDGWTPNPGIMAPRKFKLTPWGWFPEDDGFGPCKS
jgi:hypothetical protein